MVAECCVGYVKRAACFAQLRHGRVITSDHKSNVAASTCSTRYIEDEKPTIANQKHESEREVTGEVAK